LFEGKSYWGVPMILLTNWLAIIDQEKTWLPKPFHVEFITWSLPRQFTTS